LRPGFGERAGTVTGRRSWLRGHSLPKFVATHSQLHLTPICLSRWSVSSAGLGGRVVGVRSVSGVGTLAIVIAIASLPAAIPARGADIQPLRMATKAPPPWGGAYDWTGPYVGFHFGYGGGSFGDSTNPIPLQGVFFPPTITGLIGGYQAGYNHQ